MPHPRKFKLLARRSPDWANPDSGKSHLSHVPARLQLTHQTLHDTLELHKNKPSFPIEVEVANQSA